MPLSILLYKQKGSTRRDLILKKSAKKSSPLEKKFSENLFEEKITVHQR